MSEPAPTSWTLIEGAARGDPAHRERFVATYGGTIREYLAARWRRPAQRQEIEDGVQEVLYACLRDDGALARSDRSRPRRFRAFLYGVTRNTALQIEERVRRERRAGEDEVLVLENLESRDAALSVVFDRAWANAILAAALDRQAAEAERSGAEARRRLELLRERFVHGRHIRDIAVSWDADPARLHHEFARARREFLESLRETLREETTGETPVTDGDVEDLLRLLP